MKDIRLIEILRTFTEEELKSLEKFLHSPFVKSRRNIYILLNYLKKFHPEYDSPSLEKDVLFKKIFPDEKFNEKKLANYIFDLTKAAEGFIIHNNIETDEVESLTYLANGLFKKKLYEQGLRVIKNAEKKLQVGFSPEKNFFYRTQMLENLKVIYFASKDDHHNIIKSEDNFFEATVYLFLTNYTWMMTRKSLDLEYYKKDNKMAGIIEKSFDPAQLFKHLNKSNFKNNKILQLNQLILKTISDFDNIDNYYRLKETVYKNLKTFDRFEKFMLINHLRNIGIYFNYKGNKDIMYDLFELDKLTLEENAYSPSESEYMSIIDYRNTFEGAITIREFDFALHFVVTYTDALRPEERTGVRDLCIARIHFKKNQFEKSFEIISGINKINPIFKFDLDILTLMLFYELKYFDQAFSKIDTLKHYIYRDKYIKDEIKNLFRFFLIGYFEILKRKTGQSKTDPSYIKDNIKKIPSYNYKRWLLDKCDDLIKAFGKFKEVI